MRADRPCAERVLPPHFSALYLEENKEDNMDLHAFLKQNKKAGEKEELYVVSKAFVDEKGEPIPWKFRAISSEEFNQIRKRCTKMVQIPGKNQFRQDMDTDLLNNILIARCTVEPDLQNDELLRSYGVASPEELIPEMVNLPGEYFDLLQFVNKLCGFDVGLQDKVDQVKD